MQRLQGPGLEAALELPPFLEQVKNQRYAREVHAEVVDQARRGTRPHQRAGRERPGVGRGSARLEHAGLHQFGDPVTLDVQGRAELAEFEPD